MYDEDKIRDSLDFVEQIRLYDTFDPEHISDIYLDEKRKDNIAAIHYADDESNEDMSDTYSDKVKFSIPEEAGKGILHNTIWGDIVYIFVCMVISLVVAFCFTRFVAHHTIVDGNSMNTALEDRDCLIIEKLSYYFHPPERYDIIVFPYSDDVNYIKRIIGLPGEKVQITDGYVYINDKKLTDDIYCDEIINNSGVAASPIIIGEDEYFVLGDNRNASYDSRKSDVGLVKGSKIEGKAVFRLWPFDSLGTLY